MFRIKPIISTIFTLVPLFFGLITAYSFPTVGLNAAVFGLLAEAQVNDSKCPKKIAIWLLLGLFYSGSYYISGADRSVVFVGLLIFTGTYWLSHWLRLRVKQLVHLVISLLIFGLVLAALIDGSQLYRQISRQPAPPLVTDMNVYLATIYEYKKTGDYYLSLATSLKNMDSNSGSRRLAGEIWGWKQPLIFTVWKLLPGSAASVQWLGVVVFSLALLASYSIAQLFLVPKKALIAPFVLAPYFHYPLVEMTLMQLEWWALFFFLIAFLAYLRQRYFSAGIAFVLTLAVRELFAVPILGLVIIQLLRKNFRGAWRLGLPTLTIFFPYYYFYHLQNVFHYEPFNLFSRGTLRSSAANGWEFVRTTLAYNSWSYALWPIRPFLLLLAISSLGITGLLILSKKRWQYASLLTGFLLFFLLSFRLGIMDVWHDYWGIYYVPLLLLTVPIVFGGLGKYFRSPKTGFK